MSLRYYMDHHVNEAITDGLRNREIDSITCEDDGSNGHKKRGAYFMTLQTLKIGNKDFVLLPKRDFEKLAAQADRQMEDDYWTESALQAEAKALSRREKPIAFEEVERELDVNKSRSRAVRPRRK